MGPKREALTSARRSDWSLTNATNTKARPTTRVSKDGQTGRGQVAAARRRDSAPAMDEADDTEEGHRDQGQGCRVAVFE